MEEWVIQRLRERVRGVVSTDIRLRQVNSTDASMFSILPAVVAVPEDVDDLKSLVRNANNLSREGVVLTLAARAGGTCFTGGSLTDSIVVDMKRGFSWVSDINAQDKSVWVGAGTYMKDIEHALTQHGLQFAVQTSNYDQTVIGGLVGNNASGEKSFRYGSTADNVLAVKIVACDGNEYEFGPMNASEFAKKASLDSLEGHIYRELDALIEANWTIIQDARPKVRKSAAGYNLWSVVNKDQDDFNIAKLIIGSQGTLGIVTAVKLRLVETSSHCRTIIVPLTDLTDIAFATQAIVAHHPESIEAYDKYTYQLAEKHMPEEAKKAHLAKDKEMVLVVSFAESTKDQADHYAEVCKRALVRKNIVAHIIADKNEASAHRAIRHASAQLFRKHTAGNNRLVPIIDDTIVGIDHYGEYLLALEAILSDYDMTYVYTGDVADGTSRIMPIVDMSKESAEQDIYDLARRTYELVLAFEGSMSASHNDGILRTPFLPIQFSDEIMELFVQTKLLFDPLNLFNAGKKVGISEEYARSCIVKL